MSNHILPALHGALAISRSGGVLVFIDLSAPAILLAVQPDLLCGGQVAVVSGDIIAFLFLDAIPALLQLRLLLRGQRAAVHALGNAVLLVGFAPIHFIDPGVAGIGDSRAGFLRRGEPLRGFRVILRKPLRDFWVVLQKGLLLFRSHLLPFLPPLAVAGRCRGGGEWWFVPRRRPSPKERCL